MLQQLSQIHKNQGQNHFGLSPKICRFLVWKASLRYLATGYIQRKGKYTVEAGLRGNSFYFDCNAKIHPVSMDGHNILMHLSSMDGTHVNVK